MVLGHEKDSNTSSGVLHLTARTSDNGKPFPLGSYIGPEFLGFSGDRMKQNQLCQTSLEKLGWRQQRASLEQLKPYPSRLGSTLSERTVYHGSKRKISGWRNSYDIALGIGYKNYI